MVVRFGFSLQGRGALADRETITALARRAEALGYDSIWVTDRLLIPVESRSAYPYSSTGAFPLGPDEPWLESLTAITYLATATQRITVGTSVLVIPYRNPIITAKALATADYLSGGRIILGAGAGWWPSDKMHVVERLTRTSKNLLTYQITIEDPVVLAKPWKSAPRAWSLAQDPNDYWTEVFCTLNEEPSEIQKQNAARAKDK